MSDQQFKFNWLDLPCGRRIHMQAMQFQLSQSEKFPSAALKRLQFANLQRLLEHSIKYVPY